MSHWIMGVFVGLLGLAGLFMAGAARDSSHPGFWPRPLAVRHPVLLVDDQDGLR